MIGGAAFVARERERLAEVAHCEVVQHIVEHCILTCVVHVVKSSWCPDSSQDKVPRTLEAKEVRVDVVSVADSVANGVAAFASVRAAERS